MKTKMIKWMAIGAGAIACVIACMGAVGGSYYGGSLNLFSSKAVAGGTNSYSSVLGGGAVVPATVTNVALPGSLAGSASTNLYYQFPVGNYKDFSLQFTGSNTVANASNVISIVIGANNDGSTNVVPLFTWSCGVTNVTAGTNSSYVTNLNSANYNCGAYQYLYIVSMAASAGGGSPVLTNYWFSLNGK